VTLDVYVVRHGATEWSESGRHTSHTDLDLLPGGEEQARRVGRLLRDVPLEAVYASDLRRARRTAELAGFAEPRLTPLLREFDYGAYEGRTTRDIQRERPGWELFRDGCPKGETPDQVYDRARGFLRLFDGQTGSVAVFSHGHFLRTLAAAWTELEVTAAARLALDPGTLSLLRDGDHGRVIQRWNLPA
jgi:broad specificity phosphatase PhoE